MRATNEKMDEAIERLQKIADDENAPAEERGRAKRALRVLVVEKDDDDDDESDDDLGARAARVQRARAAAAQHRPNRFSVMDGGANRDLVGQAIGEIKDRYYTRGRR